MIGLLHLFVDFFFFSFTSLREIKMLHFLQFKICFTSESSRLASDAHEKHFCLARETLLPLAITLHVICKYIG